MYITDEEFLAAQKLFVDEKNEMAALSLIKDIFWPYLNNLAFCTARKILSKKGVLCYYSIEDIDSIAKDAVCIILKRYIDSWHKKGHYFNRHKAVYSKQCPKAMVWQACIKVIYKHKQREVPIDSIDIIDENWEDRIIEKTDNERAAGR